MKSSARVVVIGGGVVGASVLYHLTELGWTDVVLVERKELTAGSTWHAAGGMHTLNGDPNVAKLQGYTVGLYREIEQRSGQNCSIHMPGGLMLAGDRERMDWLRMAQARGRYLGMDLEIISAAEAKRLFPLLAEQYFIGALYDPAEGHVDPTGVTRAYAACARQAGAEVYQHTWVNDLRQRRDGTWDVITDSGEIHAEHIVNAGGLWAREVGRMIGLELPVLAMEHMYLITEDMEEVAGYNAATGRELPMGMDFDGEIYIRQEGGGILLGTYEQACVPWSPRETPWTFERQLLTPDLDRIAPSLEIAFKHYPALADAGIKTVINGPFTFAPDGNPLVGPVPGVRNCWMACAVMAGFSQGGGVGLTLARWMVDGDPGDDVWAMDVARFGDWANLAYTNAKVRENYSRRFRITFPNEELPAGRPLHTTPVYDRLTAHNAVWGAGFGLEHPLWFQRPGEEPREDVTFRRSNAFPVVADECTVVRERVGLTECSNFAKYRVTGAGSADWLPRLFTNRLPQPAGSISPPPWIPAVTSSGSSPWRGSVRTISSCSARRSPKRTTRAGSEATSLTGCGSTCWACPGRPLAGRPARPRRAAVGHRRIAGHRGLPVPDVPPDRRRDDPRLRRPDDLHRGSRLRDLGRTGVPASAVRSAVAGRAAVRRRPVRVPGADVAAHGEDVRHVGSRIPSGLHAGGGANGPVAQARP